MANQTHRLTVDDLEEAKDRVRSSQDIAMSEGDHRNYELYGIAETCIGFVEEMVKCGDLNDKMHFADLHNLWLKAFAAFGGEVK